MYVLLWKSKTEQTKWTTVLQYATSPECVRVCIRLCLVEVKTYSGRAQRLAGAGEGSRELEIREAGGSHLISYPPELFGMFIYSVNVLNTYMHRAYTQPNKTAPVTSNFKFPK